MADKQELIAKIEKCFSFMQHNLFCDWHTSDVCTCGMSQSATNLKKCVDNLEVNKK